jgi:hypothetical protein
MSEPNPSPVDGTPSTQAPRAVRAVVIGMMVAWAINPGAVGRWGYMLNDNAWNRPVQVTARKLSSLGTDFYARVGLPVPFDEIQKAGTWLRTFVPGDPDLAP